ncbi:peptidyl-prolyl cis-trans isomerase [Rhodovastum atsumiense]|uniref:peptidylprolyl isomerase n=1 Tax=Rhodovastum atsumiense TaxID=504468 RepID=A0A5M6IN61_9PROT|nr:peptidyl-prolyl cis-trans isomerase [Rhodovastum atsumiense]
MTADLQRQIREQWDEDRERHPTPEQVQQMVDLWVASEVLYREGKTMGLDRGDEMIRTRVAHKLQIMIFGDVRVSSPTESQIREWYAQNRWRYDTPEKVSFYLAPAASEAEANRFLTEMEAGKEPEELQQSARAFIGRPSQSIAVSLGQPFLDRLLALPHGQWHAIQSKEGWHVARLDEVVPAVIVPIESVLSQAIEQWKTDETRRQALEALARLRSKYTIRYEPAA